MISRKAMVAALSVVIIVALTAVSFLDRNIISLMVPLIREDLGATDFEVSLLQGAAFGIAYALAAIPFGHAADAASPRLVIFAGVLIWGAAATLCGFATSFAGLVAARMFVGIGEAALGPSSYSLLSRLFPKERLALVISICALGAIMGSAAALAIGGQVLSWALAETPPFALSLRPWQIAFIVTGAPALAAAFLAFLLPASPKAKTAVQASWGEVLGFMARQRGFFACHLLGFACCMLLVYAQLAWLPTILQRLWSLDVGEAAHVVAGFSVGTGIAGLLLNGWIVDAWFAAGRTDAHLRYYAIAMIIVAIAGALTFAAESQMWIYLGLLAIPSVLLNFTGAGAAALQIVTPVTMRGRVSAIFLAAISLIGITLGPSAPAFLTDFVFADDAAVHVSLATSYFVAASVAVVLFALGTKYMRGAVAAAT